MPYYEDDALAGYGDEIVPVGYDEEELGYEEDEYVGARGDAVQDLLDAISGVDDDYDGLVGARRRPRRRVVRKRRKAPQQPRAQFAMMPQRPKQARRYPLGLGTTAVAAGATVIIAVNPQLPFKLMRLSTAVAGFMINDIQIGTTSQFVAAGAIPSALFAPTSIGNELKGDTANPGIQIQITVTNTTAGPLDFTGALWGYVAQ